MNRHRLLLACGGLIATLLIGLGMSMGIAAASPRAAADQTWTDPVGDAAGGAPDITAVSVGNDTAGTITITFTVALVEPMSSVVVLLDTNLNGKYDDATDKMTGAASLGQGLAISMMNKNAPLMAHVVVSATTLALSFSKADAGIDKAFTFVAATQSAAQFGTDQLGDFVPDGSGGLTYVLSAPAAPTPTTTTPSPTPTPTVVRPVIGAPVAIPRSAIAGKRMAVTFPVTRSDTHRQMTSGRMICDPSVAGKVIPHSESFTAGKARLSFMVPKSAKGKLLRVKVTIRAGAQSATRIATFRVV